MDPRLQAGLELQLDKQAQQENDSSLSGVLGQCFKQAEETPDGHPVLRSIQDIIGAVAGVPGARPVKPKYTNEYPEQPILDKLHPGIPKARDAFAKYVASPTTEEDLYRRYGRVPGKTQQEYEASLFGVPGSPEHTRRHRIRYPLR